MSPAASFIFLPWVRLGLSASIEGAEPGATGRASIPVELELDVGTAGVSLELLGAQDVVGLDARAVVRTWPRPDVFDAEPNLLVLAEFDQPDLPWRYTPLAADERDRLRPWLVLIVLAEGEFQLAPATSTPEPSPPVLTVGDARKLPDLSQSWAWAHAQVSGTSRADAGEVAALLAREPHRLVSRLLCPCRLEPRKRYSAFVVPAFLRGVRAVLQETGTAPAALDPSWATGATGEVRLPVYYHWRFGTGAAGDFEALARALTPLREMPAGLGTRPLDVGAPGLGLPPAHHSDLDLEGALSPPRLARTDWSGPAQEHFEEELETLLGTAGRLAGGPEETDVTAVVPPIYGRWHAALSRRGVSAPLTAGTASGDPPAWLTELNRDPRTRVAAGLGTLVVQAKQVELMAGAWQQLGPIRKVNEALRFAQVAREGGLRMFGRHFTSADDGPLLQLTAPVHSRVRQRAPGTLTVSALTNASVIEGALQPAWRRLARPRGPLGRRQGRARADLPTQARLDDLLNRLNRGAINPAARPPNPPGLPTMPGVASSIASDEREREQLAGLERLASRFTLAGMTLLVAPFGESYARPPRSCLSTLLTLPFSPFRDLYDTSPPWLRSGPWKELLESTQRPDARQPDSLAKIIAGIPPHPDFQAVEFDPAQMKPPLPDQPEEGGQDSESAAAFRTALRELFDRSRVPRAAPPEKFVDVPALRAAVVRALDPNVTVAARFAHGLRVDPRLSWSPRDVLEPILAAPEFEQPMYVPLRDLSQDWLLPGLEHVPQNTVALLETNQRFVEAYMVGLSHEFSRELVWNEYPTDQRGTYFRQFWDAAGHVTPGGTAADRESLYDIRKIHLWGSSTLGSNSPRPLPPGAGHEGERLVLLIRGELLRRYPTATVYAVYSASSGPAAGDRELYPIFRGTLPPDVTFLGFDLTIAEAATPPRGAGLTQWYFVLQEQAGEARFGFDETSSGGDLSWTELGVAGGAQIAVSASRRLGRTAAEVARGAFRRPVRVLIPAASLLPASV
ncbi:MAG TPA: hypothetical protein VJ866_23390 [Pyrinomonadaceae bacterium]|nr:hypothetical protein [Pyrinomonadaceae bacterium]